MKSFGPVITAMVTPFDEYNQLNISSLRKLIIHLLKHGSTSLVITGTTGEAPTLTAIERLRIWETAVATRLSDILSSPFFLAPLDYTIVYLHPISSSPHDSPFPHLLFPLSDFPYLFFPSHSFSLFSPAKAIKGTNKS